MFLIDAKPGIENFIGRRGENETRGLRFWVGDILSEYPDALITLLHQRKTDTAAYPVGATQIEGENLIWTIHSADVAIVGKGVCDLTATHEGQIVKTEKYYTRTEDTLNATDTPPEPWESWVEDVLEAAETAQEAAEESATNVTHYPRVDDGYWQVWDAENEAFVSTGVKAQGEQGEKGDPGEDGFSPTVGISSIAGGHTVTVTDATGDHAFDVMDGTRGAPGQDGVSPSVAVSEITGGHEVTITDRIGDHVFDVLDGEDGEDGAPGQDGVSPTVSVSEIEDGHRVTITDKTGGHAFDVLDGEDGEDGTSPTVSVETITGGHAVTITDALETNTFNVMDGEDGTDGVSPTVTVSSITGGHTVTITDGSGDHSFNVMDGAALIDDTAGYGDTDKAWSADKLYDTFGGKADKADTVLDTTLSRGRKANTTVGTGSFAFGDNVEASGAHSHAEGYSTKATSMYAHAEGAGTTASDYQAHAEGGSTTASGSASHAEGGSTTASGNCAHAEGYGTAASGLDAHAEGGSTTASGSASHAEGGNTTASGNQSHAEGSGTTASQSNAHAEGQNTNAVGEQAHAEGGGTTASGGNAHAEGSGTKAQGNYSHTEGGGTTASGAGAHAEGGGTKATAANAHAEGGSTTASGDNAHAEGSGSMAIGSNSHAEGSGTYAYGLQVHTEGGNTEAHGSMSHAEGFQTKAFGAFEHVSGLYNVADTAPAWVANTSYVVGNMVSRVETFTDGGGTSRTRTVIYKCIQANSDSTFNIYRWTASGQYLEVVGNGTSANNGRSNARALDWDGNERLKGDLYVGCNADSTGGTKVAKAADTVLDTTLSRGRKANTTVGTGSFAFGYDVEASGDYSHAEGYSTKATGAHAHAEGNSTTASGALAHAEGQGTTASGGGSHAEGAGTTASNYQAHAEGAGTTASGNQSHAEGSGTTASGSNAHAEGGSSRASGDNSHAEGSGVLSAGNGSHAEGGGTQATDGCAHAEGAGTIAAMYGSHAEGGSTKAFGGNAHAEGGATIASGAMSHAEGNNTIAIGRSEHVSGEWNVADNAPAWVANTSYAVGDKALRSVTFTDGNGTSRTRTVIYECLTANSDSEFTSANWVESGQYLEVVGNGTLDNARSNARALDWDGNEYLKGDVYVGCGTDSTGGTKLAKTTDVAATSEMIAPYYDELTFPVAEGTPCVHDGVIYRANQAISTSEAWTAAHWTAVANVMDEVGSLKSALNVLEPAATSGDVGKVPKIKTVSDGKVSEYEFGSLPTVPVTDVQVDGVSILSNGVANIPYGSASVFGAISINSAAGLQIDSTSKKLMINKASENFVKAGANLYHPIVPSTQHVSTFYGLAKVAGADMKDIASVTVGTYPEAQKSAISGMLNAPETVSGSTPSITAKSGVRYVCGECATLTVVLPASGCVDVVFESGSTATVLTITPPTGVTAVKWVGDFDPTSLEANTRYEILIDNGEWGMACAWT